MSCIAENSYSIARLVQTSEMCLEAVRRNGMALRYVIDKTPLVCLVAVRENGKAIAYVPHHLQTVEMAREALRSYPPAYNYITIEHDDVREAAIHADPFNLALIRPMEPWINLALRLDGTTIRLVPSPTEEMCIAAVRSDYRAIDFISHRTTAVIKAALASNGLAIVYLISTDQSPIDTRPPLHLSDDLLLTAVRSNGMALKHIAAPSAEIIEEAVKQNGLAIAFVRSQTPRLCQLAFAQNPFAIYYCSHQSSEMITKALQTNIYLAEGIKTLTKDQSLALVQRDGLLLGHTHWRTKDVCSAALRQNLNAYQFITPEEKRADPAMGDLVDNLYSVLKDMASPPKPVLIVGKAFSSILSSDSEGREFSGKEPEPALRQEMMARVTLHFEPVTDRPDHLAKYRSLLTETSEESKTLAVQMLGAQALDVIGHTPDLDTLMVELNGLDLVNVHHQTEAVCLAAVRQHPAAIRHVHSITPAIEQAVRETVLRIYPSVRLDKMSNAELIKWITLRG